MKVRLSLIYSLKSYSLKMLNSLFILQHTYKRKRPLTIPKAIKQIKVDRDRLDAEDLIRIYGNMTMFVTNPNYYDIDLIDSDMHGSLDNGIEFNVVMKDVMMPAQQKVVVVM